MENEKIPTTKGAVLRSLREQTGLSRVQFSKKTGVSPHTLRSIEDGLRELSPKKYKLFSNIFSNLGISLDSSTFFYSENENKKEIKKRIIQYDNHALNVQNEIDFFKKTNAQCLLLKIQDDLMSPFFNEGDIVGGIKVKKEKDFPIFNGHVCLIEGVNGEKVLRKIIGINGKVVKSCVFNVNNHDTFPTYEETEILHMAQVSRHWHLSNLVGLSNNQ